MRLSCKLVVLAAFLVGFSGVCSAAEIVGARWVASEAGFQMQLAPDGAYAFMGPGFSSNGMYLLNGQFLVMQDASTGVQTMFQLSRPSPQTLIMTDSTGVSLEMRADEANGMQPSPATDPGSQGMAEVLANSGGVSLTTREMQVGYDLAELVIDQRLSEDEKARLIAASITEFEAAPEEFLRQIEELRGTMAQLGTIEDPFMLGLARQTLFAQFYLATRDFPSQQIPELIKIMREHLRVVAEDPSTQLVLTDRDVRAMMEYNQFMAQVTGTQIDPATHMAGALENQLRASFPSLPLETQQTLAAMYPVWQATQYSWSMMNDQQRNQVVMQMRQQAQAPNWNGNGGAQGLPPEPNSEWGRTSSGRMALEMMRSANSARIMSAVIDTNAGFTACLTCSPGINPFK